MATATHEQTINTAFAEVVEGVGRGWSIRAENVGGVFEGGGRPDVLIEKGDGWPIVIEAEVGNHHQAEVEAISRLNRRVASTGPEDQPHRRAGNACEGFDYPTLLDQIWSRQNDEAADDLVPYRSVFQQQGWRDTTDMVDFARRPPGSVGDVSPRPNSTDATQAAVGLHQPPPLILEQMHKTLAGLGHDAG